MIDFRAIQHHEWKRDACLAEAAWWERTMPYINNEIFAAEPVRLRALSRQHDEKMMQLRGDS